ncbi:hypothetical protein BDQ17DRAFT_1392721 [Cyathus striatus]|nr:hypothetical protein BDQ17DRAFT_1392721 [Cyathus striatus]
MTLWKQNPVDCIRELIGNPDFKDHLAYAPRFADQFLHLVDPFWQNLPHCNIFSCIIPDILHQLHKGIFKDHVFSWAMSVMGGSSQAENIREVDERFKAMTTHQALRHFKKGISLTSQWTGTEHKNMEKVFLGILTVKGVLDFIYYAHFETHTTESLTALDLAWETIHRNKDVFIDLGIREHFNIRTADGYSTEGTEHLHIDLAKTGYGTSNKKDYTSQMAKWLQCQESIYHFGVYLQWAAPGYKNLSKITLIILL